MMKTCLRSTCVAVVLGFITLFLASCAQNTAGIKDSAIPAEELVSIGKVDDKDSSHSELGSSRYSKYRDNPSWGKYPTVWARLFSLFTLPEVSNSRIDRELEWFLRNPDYLQRVQRRAEPYLFEIVNQIEQQGVPGEIALLPVVESAFQAHAYSHASASGLWQFIPSTGRLYGLKQNWWYDGRRDVYAATQAAIRYLQKVNNDFNGDWLLALAAYNCGEARVQKEIDKNRRRNRPVSFWSLNLPRETRNYVPRLLAVSHLFANAKRYRLSLRPIPDRPVIQPVYIGSQLDLALAAEMAELSMAEFYELNPGFNQWATDPNGPHRLLLPVDKVQPFTEKLAKLPPDGRIHKRHHKVRRGDSLRTIARMHGTTVALVKRTNGIIGHSAPSGEMLIIPVSAKDLSHYQLKSAPKPNRRSASRKRKKGPRKITYKVRRGDTLSKIARRYSVSVKKLAKWNRIRSRSVIRTGQRLSIWTNRSKSVSRSKSNPFQRYTVRKGDSLYLIACSRA